MSRPRTSTTRSPSSSDRRRSAKRSPSRCSATPAKSCPNWCAAASGPTSSPTRPPRTIRSTAICPRAGRLEQWEERRASDPEGSRARRQASMGEHVRAMLAFAHAGVPTVDYGNNIRQMALEEGVEDAFDFPGFVPAYIRPAVLPRHRAVPLGRALGRSGGHLPHRRESQRADARQSASAHLARHGARADQVPGPAGPHLLGGPRRPPSARARVQRNGGVGRTQGADRHRPRSSRFGLGRLAQPRNRSDEGRLRRRSPTGRCSTRSSIAPRARPGCRSIMAAASAWAFRSTPAW